MNFKRTLDDPVWFSDNRDKLLAMLPKSWTLVDEHAALRIGFSLKLIGLDWRQPDDIALIMTTLHRVYGLVQHRNLPNGSTEFRADPNATVTITLIA